MTLRIALPFEFIYGGHKIMSIILGKLTPEFVFINRVKSEYECFYQLRVSILNNDNSLRDKNLPSCINMLKRYVLGLVGDLHLSEDLTAESIVKILSKAKDNQIELNKYSDKQFKSWCYTLTHNHTIDKLRKKKVRIEDITAKSFQFSTSAVNPFAQEEEDVIIAYLKRELSDTCYSVFKLSLEDLSMDEIATEVGKSVKSVRNCRTDIKKLLQNHRS